MGGPRGRLNLQCKALFLFVTFGFLFVALVDTNWVCLKIGAPPKCVVSSRYLPVIFETNPKRVLSKQNSLRWLRYLAILTMSFVESLQTPPAQSSDPFSHHLLVLSRSFKDPSGGQGTVHSFRSFPAVNQQMEVCFVDFPKIASEL